MAFPFFLQLRQRSQRRAQRFQVTAVAASGAEPGNQPLQVLDPRHRVTQVGKQFAVLDQRLDCVMPSADFMQVH